MIQPINYYQTDKDWSSKPYRTSKEKTTIGSDGCGPTCAAMIINSIKGNNVTPVDTCNWSMEHGYKATGQGTYWAYFIPQFKAYGITCKQTYSSDTALSALKKGNWVIGIMKKGNWTSGGHFVLAYGYEDKYVFINDPASTLERRTHAKWSLFTSEALCYWIITVPNDIKINGIKPERKSSIIEMYVSSNTLKVRSGAGSLKKQVDTLKRNEKVEIIASKGNWVMIGQDRWVNSKFLSKHQQLNLKYKTLMIMNVRDGYTTKGTKIIGKVKKNTIFTVSKIRGNWGYSKEYKGWICLKGGTKTYCEEVK